MYCQPPKHYTAEEWKIIWKTVLEVIIPRDKTDKHKAPDNLYNYRIFVRLKDENLMSTILIIQTSHRTVFRLNEEAIEV